MKTFIKGRRYPSGREVEMEFSVAVLSHSFKITADKIANLKAVPAELAPAIPNKILIPSEMIVFMGEGDPATLDGDLGSLQVVTGPSDYLYTSLHLYNTISAILGYGNCAIEQGLYHNGPNSESDAPGDLIDIEQYLGQPIMMQLVADNEFIAGTQDLTGSILYRAVGR